MAANNGKMKTQSKRISEPLAPGYKAAGGSIFYWHPALSAQMTWSDIPAMLRDYQIQLCMRILLGPLDQVKWQIDCKNAEAKQFIEQSLRMFWRNDMRRLCKQMLEWGTCPGEILYDEADDGQWTYKGVNEFHLMDITPWVVGREVVYIELRSAIGESQMPDGGFPEIHAPRLWWAANEPNTSRCYGVSRLFAAFDPWMSKTGRHGAINTEELWAYKNAFGGGIVRFPEGGSIEIADGVLMSNQDYAREMIEKMLTGAVVAMPSSRDERGNYSWEYVPPAINGNGETLAARVKELDERIGKGMGILPEIIQAAETGSGWSGRSVPMLMFLASEDNIAKTMISAFDRCFVRHAVEHNFGEVEYQIVPLSLVETSAQAAQQSQQPGQPGAGAKPGGGGLDLGSLLGKMGDDGGGDQKTQPPAQPQQQPAALSVVVDEPAPLSLTAVTPEGKLDVAEPPPMVVVQTAPVDDDDEADDYEDDEEDTLPVGAVYVDDNVLDMFLGSASGIPLSLTPQEVVAVMDKRPEAAASLSSLVELETVRQQMEAVRAELEAERERAKAQLEASLSLAQAEPPKPKTLRVDYLRDPATGLITGKTETWE